MTTPPGYSVPPTEMRTTVGLPPPNAMCNDTVTIHSDPGGDCSKFDYFLYHEYSLLTVDHAS